MAAVHANDPEVLRSYEGVVFTTTKLIAPFVEADFEDIRQIFRLKVWRALQRYDPAVWADRDGYVFMCLTNQKKDLLQRVRRGDCSLDGLTEGRSGHDYDDQTRADRFARRHGLVATHDEVYGSVDSHGFTLPNTLTDNEQRIVCLLYEGYTQTEARGVLGMRQGEMERAVRSIRMKLADWRPASLELAPAPSHRASDPATQVAA